MLLKEQNFGVEIELTGITRERAAGIIAQHFGTSKMYLGSGYQTWGATDTKGRTWKAMRDASINPQRKVDGRKISASDNYKCEVVTPILQYADMEDLQEIIRKLAKAGAFANGSCGIHVHVDASRQTVDSLQRLMNFAVGRQDLFYEALQVTSERSERWCKKMDKRMLNALKKDSTRTKSSVERIWYSRLNDGYNGCIDHGHYNSTRYHGINFHAFFTKGTVEYRLFNGTTHAGKIKAYVQFCLAMSAWAVEGKGGTNLFFKSVANYTQEQKAELMLRILKNRLGMKGKEFRTARLHLTSAFTGQSIEEVA